MDVRNVTISSGDVFPGDGATEVPVAPRRRTVPAGGPATTGVPSDDATSTGYPRKRARTRRQLLHATMAVLADRGPDGATVGAVARRAKVSPGTFYNHFDDLAAAIDAVVDELSAGVEIERERLAAIEHDAAARVAIGTLQLLDLARVEPDTARAFVTLLATVPEFRSRVRATVRRAVEDGIAERRFGARPSELTADAVIGAATQWMRTILAGEHAPATDAEYLEVVLHIAGAADTAEARRVAIDVAARSAA